MDNLVQLIPCFSVGAIIGIAVAAAIVARIAYRHGVKDGTEFGLRVSGEHVNR